MFLPVFRILFSSPKLKNINAVGSNTACLDLADSCSRLGIQITTDGSAEKITDALTCVISKRLTDEYDRVVVFVLQATRRKYRTETKSKWEAILDGQLEFAPARDIIELPTLLSRIEALPTKEVVEIHSEIARTVIGAHYVDAVSLVRDVSDKHLEYEKRTARYIPGVFVETRETKQLCRSFCHPSLFLQRSIESARRADLGSWNDFLQEAGMELLQVPILDDMPDPAGIPDVAAFGARLYASYDSFLTTIEDYNSRPPRRGPLPSATERQRAFYEANTHVLTNELQGVKYTIRDIRDEFESSSKRVLLITGAAGQGKTNLLCDFYDNFLVKHGIPCAFLSGREIGLKGGEDLAEVLRRHLFGTKAASLEDGIALLSAEALKLNKPFVLLIDGLNEHRNIGTFSHQLEYVVDSLLVYPGVRFLFSCRSEFFRDRFSNLMDGPLKPYVMLCEAAETRLDDEERGELVPLYFDYFEVDGGKIASDVAESLEKDLLLLRVFCETYGKRGKSVGYLQPEIRHLYRDELFERYVEQKLRSAGSFLQTLSNTASPISTVSQLRKVLDMCLRYMVENEQCLGVPIDAVSSDLHQALYVLLDEELIIRRDASPDTSRPESESINFTFDELRDYLMSQFMIKTLYMKDKTAFEETLKRLSPERATTEGIQRFLFYASRKPENVRFYEDYRHRAPYRHAYAHEVFNLDQACLTADDVAGIRVLLAKMDREAQSVARSLAVRWNSVGAPVLNLSVLNSFVLGAGVDAYRILIEGALGAQAYSEMPLAEQCCRFCVRVAEQVDVNEFPRYRELVKLLILLLPITANSRWESPALIALQKLMERDVEGVTQELLEFPLEGFPPHRRFVWRLLYESMTLKPNRRVLERAELCLRALGADDDGLAIELRRFCEKFKDAGQ